MGFALGSRFGESLFATRLGRRLVKPQHRERAEELIRRRGAAAVFVGRLSAVLRVLVPGLAGMSGMPYGRFLWFNVLGALVWAGGFTLVGYAAGTAWRKAAHVAARASALLAGLLVVIGFAVLLARWLIRHENDVRTWWSRQIERPRVVALRRRYERQLAYAQKRLDPRGAFGLYLTIGLAVSLAMGWALGATVQDHYASDVVAAAALGATWLALSSTAWLTWDRLGASPALRKVRDRAARRLLKSALLAASLGILVHVVLLALPGIRKSFSALGTANLGLVAGALAAEVVSNAALAELYRRALCVLGPSIGYRDALRMSMGMFTVGRVVPGGGAAAAVWGTRELTRLGVETPTATTSVVLGGTIGMATLGVIVFAGSAASLVRGDLTAGYAIGIGVVLTLLAGVGVAVWKALHSDALRHRILESVEAALRKMRIKADLSSWAGAADGMVRSLAGKGHLLAIARWSAANWLLDAAALWLLFLAFGYRMHVGILLVGYGVANLVTALPLTPGGLGLVEAGLAGTYTAFGAPGHIAIVAVLAYRLLSYWLPLLAGVPAYLGGGRASDEYLARAPT